MSVNVEKNSVDGHDGARYNNGIIDAIEDREGRAFRGGGIITVLVIKMKTVATITRGGGSPLSGGGKGQKEHG